MQNQQAESIFLAWKAYHLAALPAAAVESFNRLFCSWMMFNAIYSEQDQLTGNLPQNPSERDRVESFEHQSAFGSSHTALLAINPAYAAAVTFMVNRNTPRPALINAACQAPNVKVWNLNPLFQNNAAKQGICHGANDLKGLLGCLYVARCNLVHGDKLPGNQFDIELCENAHVILSQLLLNYTLK